MCLALGKQVYFEPNLLDNSPWDKTAGSLFHYLIPGNGSRNFIPIREDAFTCAGKVPYERKELGKLLSAMK